MKEVVDSMYVFLDYRGKYYGTEARKEKGVLWEYQHAGNITAIKNKLAEYKTWWSGHKGDAINLP